MSEIQVMDRKAVAGWCLFDWANSAFPTIISTFVFATYFTKAVAENETDGTVLWSSTVGWAGLVVALLAPFLGAIADFGGRRKFWLAIFSMVCVTSSAGLWFVEPDPAFVPLAVGLVILATVGFEFSTVFYNALLPDVAPRDHLGRVSGWGWGLGYFGGLCALVICLVGFVQAETPWFGVGDVAAGGVRATSIVVAVWFALFCLPMFLWVREHSKHQLPLNQAVGAGVRSLFKTLREVRRYKTAFRFLLARMIYNDGLTTLFSMGGIYAGVTFGMSFEEVLTFAITLNVTAGLGAFVFAWLDDSRGAKWVIVVSLTSLIMLSIGILLVQDKMVFWGLGLLIGIFLGPIQAASRTMMARLAPDELRTEFFGLYALSGRATAFAGPLIFSLVTETFQSQRLGMSTILVFFVVGLLLLLPLKMGKPGMEG
ncbi:MFS transporter [Aestuariispira insulae]|uniref:UMF1 family MFS transporter n=1 Tax=Aestuariispira insulae TaxID=1461337 RepID=A0A3D9HE29_9PROT|nr:MFS transporter [Aestuariispira insulae]RED47732.1 UMF1 family MFS transporter [Aestuariispira insulae]